jgi:hypothetical protein
MNTQFKWLRSMHLLIPCHSCRSGGTEKYSNLLHVTQIIRDTSGSQTQAIHIHSEILHLTACPRGIMEEIDISYSKDCSYKFHLLSSRTHSFHSHILDIITSLIILVMCLYKTVPKRNPLGNWIPHVLAKRWPFLKNYQH